MSRFVIVLAMWVLAPAQQTTSPVASSQREIRPRFEQALSIRTAENPAQPVTVALRDWVIRNRQKVSVTTAGMLVIHMRAGDTIVTTVNEQRTERKDNDYFTVPAGASLTIETGNDTAVLTVLEVRRS